MKTQRVGGTQEETNFNSNPPLFKSWLRIDYNTIHVTTILII
jgi:hypothetical protein